MEKEAWRLLELVVVPVGQQTEFCGLWIFFPLYKVFMQTVSGESLEKLKQSARKKKMSIKIKSSGFFCLQETEKVVYQLYLFPTVYIDFNESVYISDQQKMNPVDSLSPDTSDSQLSNHYT